MTLHAPNASALRVVWITSSFSGGGNNCLQAAALDGGRVAVRDGKNPSGPALILEGSAWAAFIGGVRAGDFRRPTGQPDAADT